MAAPKMVDLHREVAVITGGNGGIGRRIHGSADVSTVRVYGSAWDFAGAVRVAERLRSARPMANRLFMRR